MKSLKIAILAAGLGLGALSAVSAAPTNSSASAQAPSASVRITGARDWVLCEHRNFMGKCVRVRAKEKDLRRLQIGGQVSSLYPVRE